MKKVEAKFCVSLLISEDNLRSVTFTTTKRQMTDEFCRAYNLQEPICISKLNYKGLRIEKSSVISVGNDENGFPKFVLIKVIVKDIGYKIVVEDLEVFNFNTDTLAYEIIHTNNFYTLNLSSIAIDSTFASCVSEVYSIFYVSWI